MDELIKLLREMGAIGVKYHEDNRIKDSSTPDKVDDNLQFTFGGKTVKIRGVWFPDDTAGLYAEVLNPTPSEDS